MQTAPQEKTKVLLRHKRKSMTCSTIFYKQSCWGDDGDDLFISVHLDDYVVDVVV